MFGFYNICHCLSEKVAFVLVAFVEWGRGRKGETYSITRLHKVFFGEQALKEDNKASRHDKDLQGEGDLGTREQGVRRWGGAKESTKTVYKNGRKKLALHANLKKLDFKKY